MKQVVCLSTEPWSPTPRPDPAPDHPAQGRLGPLLLPRRRTVGSTLAPAGQEGPPQRHRLYHAPALPVDERHDRLFRLSRQRQIRFLPTSWPGTASAVPLLWTTSLSISTPWMRWSTTVWSTTATRWGRAARPVGRAVWLVRRTWSLPLPRAGRPPLPVQRQHRAASQRVNYPLRRRGLRRASGGAGPPARAPGWAGTIHADLDLTPILYAAQARPAWTFLLLGRREENPLLRRLPACPM